MLCPLPPDVPQGQEPGLTSLDPISTFRQLPFLPCEGLENRSPLLAVPAILSPLLASALGLRVPISQGHPPLALHCLTSCCQDSVSCSSRPVILGSPCPPA